MAYLFDDASTEYLEIDQAPTAGTPFSMACWFNADALGNTKGMIWLGDKDSGSQYHCLYARFTNDVAAITTDGSSSLAVSTSTFGANAWHHAAGVWTSSTNRAVFLDGGNKGTNSTNLTPSGEDRLSVGRFGDASPGSYFSGLLAEVAIWDVALTDAEVAILAEGYSPLFVRPQSLVFYAPIIRSLFDRVGGLTLSLGGSPSVAPHSPIIHPSSIPLAFVSGVPPLPPVPEFRRRRYMIGPV